MKKVVLLTTHVWESKIKTGFHWLAHEYIKKEYEVLFATIPISFLNKIRKDYRIDLIKNKPIQKIFKKNGVLQYIHKTLFHVPSLRSKLLDKLTIPFCILYKRMVPTEDFFKYCEKAELFIFENNHQLYYLDAIKKMNPNAKYVYRVSDDMKLVKLHPHLIKHESNILHKFDLVSTPCEYIKQALQNRSKKELSNIIVHHHGVDKSKFIVKKEKPLTFKTINAVFVGNSHFDYNFLQIASNEFPNITFHIVGPIKQKILGDNVVYYGPIPFEDTVPYIQHASFGLHNMEYNFGSESLTDSLKVLQYTLCDKAIIVPSFLKTARQNSFFYKVDDKESIIKTINNALLYNSSDEWKKVSDWKVVAECLEGL